MVNNGSNGYLVGNKLSLADLALLEDVLLIEEYYGMSELESYPEIKVITIYYKILIIWMKFDHHLIDYSEIFGENEIN